MDFTRITKYLEKRSVLDYHSLSIIKNKIKTAIQLVGPEQDVWLLANHVRCELYQRNLVVFLTLFHHSHA